MEDLFKGLPNPRTSIQEVLFTLILQGNVSIFDFPWMSGFRTRVSNLKKNYDLDIITEKLTKKNKHGNIYTYCNHILPKTEIENAKNLYLKINNK